MFKVNEIKDSVVLDILMEYLLECERNGTELTKRVEDFCSRENIIFDDVKEHYRKYYL